MMAAPCLALLVVLQGAESRPQGADSRPTPTPLTRLLDRALADREYAAKGLESAAIALGKSAREEIARRIVDGTAGPNDETLVRVLMRAHADAAPPVLDALAHSESVDARRLAAVGHGLGTTAASCAELIRMLGDEKLLVVGAATDGLAKLAQNAPKLAVRRSLEDVVERGKVPLVRARAVEVLAHIASAESVPLFERMLRDADADVVTASVGALGRVGGVSDSARAAVRAMLHDRPNALRKQAALALGGMKDWAACPELIELLDDADPGVAADAVWALRRITGQEFPAMAERWRDWWKRRPQSRG